MSPLAICITLAVILCTRKVKFKEIFPVKTNAKYYLMAVLLTFGMLFIGSIVSTFFLNFLEIIGYTPDDSFLPDVSGVQILPAIIFMALIPAFFEELIFRGIILHSAEQSMGSVRAIFITGFCFALMHGSADGSSVFAWLYAFFSYRAFAVGIACNARTFFKQSYCGSYACLFGQPRLSGNDGGVHACGYAVGSFRLRCYRGCDRYVRMADKRQAQAAFGGEEIRNK